MLASSGLFRVWRNQKRGEARLCRPRLPMKTGGSAYFAGGFRKRSKNW